MASSSSATFVATVVSAYDRAKTLARAYDDAHDESVEAFQTAVNVMEQVGALERSGRRVASARTSERALARALCNVEDAFERARASVERCAKASGKMRAVAKEASANASGATPALRRCGGERIGNGYSIASLAFGLDDLARMYDDDVGVKKEILKRARQTEDEDDLNQLLRMFSAKAGVEPEVARDILSRAPAKAMKGRA